MTFVLVCLGREDKSREHVTNRKQESPTFNKIQGKSFDLRLRVGLGESGSLALMSQQWPEELRCGFVEDKRRTRKGNWCCLNKPDL